MLKKIVAVLMMLATTLAAEQLVHVEVQEGENAERLMANYSKPIFYEERFILALESETWQAAEPRQTALGKWDESLYYFILYPVHTTDLSELSNYGDLLKTDAQYYIFETKHEILNDFEIFHQFELVRLSARPIIPAGMTALPLSLEALQFNPAIQQMVDNVTADSIWEYIGALQGMQRYTTNPQAIQSSNYLKDFYLALGYDSVYFHQWQSGSIPNVVAVKYGKQFPAEIYLTGGHYDVYTNGAPGADDNGSGTAAIMEAARALSAFEYKRTLKFVSFSGEELGLLGSAAYASRAAQQGENILGMINMDMIAYVAPGDPIDVDVIKNNVSLDLFDAYVIASQTYVPTLAIVAGSLPPGASSDHVSFWQNGFKAIFPFEDSNQYSPYIHTFNDVLGTSANNQTLAELGTKSVVATLASLAEIAEARITGHVYSSETLLPIAGATVFFNGDSVQTNSQGYYITPPLNPNLFTIVFTAPGFIPDTIQHALQQFEIFNADAYLIPEGSLRPYVHLQNIIIDDDSSGSSLGNGNGVADAGETIEIFGNFMNTGNLNAYGILATAQASSPYLTILQNSMTVDSISIGGTAVSNNALVAEIDPGTPANTTVPFLLALNYQGYSSNAGFEIIVHNRGEVLIVVDDDGGNGLNTYQSALDSLDISYDIADPNLPLDDMLEYNIMIWFCGEDFTSTLTSADQQKLSSYLDDGGKLFINGVDIGYDIHTEPFYTNYLKTNYIGDGPYTAINMAYGKSGDPISGDFASGLGINDHYVDQISPAGGSEQIFRYTYNGSDYGCGIKYDGNYQLIYLTFTFEHIPNGENRKILMRNIINWFGVLTGISDGREQKPREFFLSQNYPNPFNPATIIQYQLSESGKVQLEVFNILGQRVRTLVNAPQQAGEYAIQWKGDDETGRKVASGIYVYRLRLDGKTRNYISSKKMLLLK